MLNVKLLEIKLIVLFLLARADIALEGNKYKIVDPLTITSVPPEGCLLLKPLQSNVLWYVSWLQLPKVNVLSPYLLLLIPESWTKPQGLCFIEWTYNFSVIGSDLSESVTPSFMRRRGPYHVPPAIITRYSHKQCAQKIILSRPHLGVYLSGKAQRNIVWFGAINQTF